MCDRHLFSLWPFSGFLFRIKKPHISCRLSSTHREKDSTIYDANKIAKCRTFVYHRAALFEGINSKSTTTTVTPIKILKTIGEVNIQSKAVALRENKFQGCNSEVLKAAAYSRN